MNGAQPSSSIVLRRNAWAVFAVLLVLATYLLDVYGRYWGIPALEVLRGDPIIFPRENGMGAASAPGFHLRRFVLWFVVPFCICLPWMDWGAFTFRGWKRGDWLLLGLFIAAGAAAVGAIAVIPGLRAYYPSLRHAEDADKWRFLGHMLLYTVSWIIGWEFVHRYFLLRAVDRAWGGVAVLLVPFMEAGYHLTKDISEAGAMFAFGLVAAWWARRKKNLLLPLLAHLAIEVELFLFQILI